jgi:arylsulfatase A-like enzyme
MSRLATRLLAAASLLSALPACGGEPPPAPARNVVLVVADTLRSDRLGCYGYPRPTSPHIDALAARGTLYERCYSQANWTVPSMISLMSGASICQDDTQLPSDLETLAEAVSRAGIATAGFTANAVLRRDRGFERGLDLFEDVELWPAPRVAERASEWLGALPRDGDGRPQRFFLWLQLIDPHDPYTPEPEFDVFGGPRPDQDELEPAWRAAQGEVEALQVPGARRDLDEAVAHMVAESNRYDGEVLQTDAGVGLLVDRLEALGVLDETLVIVCSDHGEMLYEQRTQPLFVSAALQQLGQEPAGVDLMFTLGHRPWYFEPLWNTPLVLAGPGFPAGLRRAGLAANLDIYPTVLEALGLRPSRPLEGRSLVGGLEPRRERVLAYGQHTSAVLEGDGEKLVLQPLRLFEEEAPLGPRVPWLFDLREGERTELSTQRPDAVERLTGVIEAWHDRHGRARTGVTTEAALDDLRRMGYAGDGAVPEDADEGPEEGTER